MLICPYCEWPFASKNELATHIQIKHKGALSSLLQSIQDDCKNYEADELDDDGVYIGDVVIHAPYDNVDNDPYKHYPQNRPMKHPGSQ